MFSRYYALGILISGRKAFLIRNSHLQAALGQEDSEILMQEISSEFKFCLLAATTAHSKTLLGLEPVDSQDVFFK